MMISGRTIVLAVVAFVLIAWWVWDPPVQVGPSPDANRRVLILLHGHGASKTDLEPLADRLALSAPDVSFILPSGPHRAGVFGRTWYPRFYADSQEEVDARLLELRAEARAVVMEIIDDLTSDGVPPQQIYVGGFSQGATVALDVALAGPEEPEVGGLVSLSGGAFEFDLTPLDQRADLRAFVSHGSSDPVLGSGRSRALVKALENSDHEVQFIEFNGGHAIPDVVVSSLGAFLNAR